MKNKIFSVLAISILTSSQIASANLPASIVAATLAAFGFGTVSSVPVDAQNGMDNLTSPYQQMPTKSATFHGDQHYKTAMHNKTVHAGPQNPKHISRRNASDENNSIPSASSSSNLVCPPGERLYSNNNCVEYSSVCSQDCYEDCYDVCDYTYSSDCRDYTTFCYENCGPVNCPCIDYETQYFCARPSSSCFSSRNYVRVKVESGKITAKSMDQLQIHDLVEVAPNQFERVITFNHRQTQTAPHDQTVARANTPFVTISTDAGKIELTADHFLYRNNNGTEEMVFAKNIQVGDRLVSKNGSELGTQVVTQIDNTFNAVDFYAPITETGTLMIYSSADLKAVGLMASVFSGTDRPEIAAAYAKIKAKAEATTDALGITSRDTAKEYGNRGFQDVVSNLVRSTTVR